MRHSIKTGFSFGLASGIMTTLGLMVGLHSGTHLKTAVLGGIFIIALADSFSDAMGIHIAEESENKHSNKEIWEATISTFIFKFVVALTFAVPVLLLTLNTALLVALGWGILLIILLSIYLARQQKKRPFKIIGEHLIVMVLVVALSHQVGDWIATLCK
ncbi:MAG: hypothetical protein AAB019_03505 [Planctomycetota bacterium]